ncbi:MAG TPA: inositol monophosphatase family protein [Opitutales bacterium]|nr:inositol monophosphatase family protein [Opitutales bacterium]
MSSASSLDPYRTFIPELAAASGPIVRKYFGNPALAVEQKGDLSPVTAADREAEGAMRRLINARFPAHGILAEEYGSERADAEWTWVLDPIDGTKSFIHGVPLFGTLIGLLHEGRPVLGAIHQPILEWLCVGDNEQTTCNGASVRVRETRTLAEATLLTTSLGSDIPQIHSAEARQRLLGAAGIVRTWGDCFGYLLVATGRANVMGDGVAHNAWDVLPLVPIIRGAGGVITDWGGGEVGSGKSCLAASPRLHRLALDLLLT